MKRIIATMALCGGLLTATAQTARDDIGKNVWLAGSNYLDYDRQLPSFNYTKAPKGYTPFYFSHYGRHGSRWLIGKDDYERVLRPLRKARQQGKLTREGQETLRKLEQFNKTTNKRLGDLTTVGERQHHGIGRRIAQHFPEIFVQTKGVAIDARSTTVNRCILSMVAECEELMAANPTARIHNDVSDALQYYLNQRWEGVVKEIGDSTGPARYEFASRNTHPERLMKVLFNDPKWVTDSIKEGPLMRNLFEIAINMQSHEEGIPDLTKLFTADEIYDQWRIQNVGWYVNYGAAPLTKGVMPFSQFNLLTNIIETADTCVQLGKPQATMRFGHEVCVLPLACLMELDSCGVAVENLDELDLHWQNYKIYPMACNIQLIFYKPKKGDGDILVKALLNEREATLPVQPTATPYYYKWNDLRAYWKKKLNDFKARYNAQ
ncbi:MAG: histidine-type phosphatase [Prevotella sp.]|nr:histidine-type phosphatase [Prevotella sp.]